MNVYIVTVKVTLLEYYEVEAATPEEALESWRGGNLLGTDDTYLETEPLKAEEVTSTSTGRAA
jgi:hypothetical protein